MARQVVQLGRLGADERTARLLLVERTTGPPGTARGGALLDLPLTQDVLADLLGLSAVHMNRALQELRRDVLVD